MGLRNVWRPPIWKVHLSSYRNDPLFVNAVQNFHYAFKKAIIVSLSLAHPVLYRAFSKDLFQKQPKRVIGYIDLRHVVLMESSRMGRENTAWNELFFSNVLLYIKRLGRSPASRENKQHEATNIASFSKLFSTKVDIVKTCFRVLTSYGTSWVKFSFSFFKLRLDVWLWIQWTRKTHSADRAQVGDIACTYQTSAIVSLIRLF